MAAAFGDPNLSVHDSARRAVGILSHEAHEEDQPRSPRRSRRENQKTFVTLTRWILFFGQKSCQRVSVTIVTASLGHSAANQATRVMFGCGVGRAVSFVAKTFVALVATMHSVRLRPVRCARNAQPHGRISGSPRRRADTLRSFSRAKSARLNARGAPVPPVRATVHWLCPCTPVSRTTHTAAPFRSPCVTGYLCRRNVPDCWSSTTTAAS